jgi:dTDP-4-amino-4,6-dideoxygalactose transaminase
MRKRLQNYLAESGIGCASYYEKSMSQEKALANFVGEKEEAEKFAGSVLCLPMNPFITEEEIRFVSGKIKKFFDLTIEGNSLAN